MKRELAPGTLALVVERSQNEKLGEVAATYAAQGSCPADCHFLDGGGCYAETGQVGKFVTAPLNASAGEATAIAIARQEAEKLDALRVVPGRPLRLHVVGDCPSDEAARIVSSSAERYMQRGGGPAFGYTHAWRDVDRASWGGVSILASCETGHDVRLARSRGYAPSIVVEEFLSHRLYTYEGRHDGSDRRDDRRGADRAGEERARGGQALDGERHSGRRHDAAGSPRPGRERDARSHEGEGARRGAHAGGAHRLGSEIVLAAQPAASIARLAGTSPEEPETGQRPGSGDAPVTSVPVLPCPAQTHAGVSCSSCGLCFNAAGILERGYAIGFALHGLPLAIRQATLALRHPEDPNRRVPSKLRLARARAAFLAERGREPTTREMREAVPGLNDTSIAEWLRYLRGEIEHPAERRRKARQAKRIADVLLSEVSA